MFYPYIENQYIYSHDSKLSTQDDFDKHKIIALPICIDTEFFDDKRKGITIQLKGIFEDEGKIYCHSDFIEYCNKNNLKPRHKESKEDLAIIDYLKDLGYEIKFTKTEYEDKEVENSLIIDLFSHFAIAELLLVVKNNLKKELIKVIQKSGKKEKEIGLYTDKKKSFISFNRRLKLYSKSKGKIYDFIDIPYQIFLNNKWYKVKLRYFDTYGLHGVSSYKNLAESVGIKLEFKENLTQYDKENMEKTYFLKPTEFDNYSLGDLEIYRILVANKDLFFKIYQQLGIENKFQSPSLTMGSTVEKLFFAKLTQYLGIKDSETEKVLLNFLSYGSAKTLKENVKDTSCLLSKVFGGRCRNNRPLNHYIETLLGDLDIDGCYGNGLRLQKLAIGKPIIESYPINSNNNYLTLREWLKLRKYNTKDNELVYGLWHSVVICDKELKYSQDFLPSWFNFKISDIKSFFPTQDDESQEINPKSGIAKIFKKEIKNSVITDDFLDFLFYVCNKNQRNELLDNLKIVSSIYYPSFSKVKTFVELMEKLEKDKVSQETKGQITTRIKDNNSYWLEIDLSDLLVDDLIYFRKLYPKKTVLNILYKLVINAIYGIFCSPYFASSSCVIGNNITARARFMCYLMEKGLNGFQSITDGCVIELNKVCYPIRNNYLTASSLIDLYQYSDKEKMQIRHIELKPLDNAEFIYYDGRNAVIYYEKNNYLLLNKKEFFNWINQKSMLHLQQVFNPNIRVLNQVTTDIKTNEDKEKIYTQKQGMYSLEIKDFFCKSYFHGSANYYLIHHIDNDKDKIAFRSYQNKKHQSYILNDNELEKYDFYNDNLSPCKYFIEQLNQKLIKRGYVFLKKRILKISDYSFNYEKYDKLGLNVGDTYYQSGLLREFSQSQLTFLTIEQYQLIDKEIARNKRRYGQSYEGYFTNNDNLLDYYLMMEVIDKAINENVTSINKYLDIFDNRLRDKNIKHSQFNCLKLIKESINNDNLFEKNLCFNVDNKKDLVIIDNFDDNEDTELIEFDLF